MATPSTFSAAADVAAAGVPLRDAAFPGGAILVALSVPGLIMGPAAIGITFGLGTILLLVSVPPGLWWPRAVHACGSPLGRLAGLVALAWVPSLIVTIDRRLSLEAYGWTLGFAAAGVVTWAMLADDRRTRPLVRRSLLGASAVAAAIACGALYGTPEILSASRFEGWVETDALGRLRSFANAAMLAVPAVLWAGATGGVAARLFGALCAVGLIAAILGTDTKAPLAGVLAAALFAVVVTAIRARPALKPTILTGLAAGFAVAVAGLLMADTPPVEGVDFDPYLPTAMFDLHRQVIWSFTFDQAREAPVFGLGINAVNQVAGSGELIPGLGPHGEYLPSHPHSWPLEIFAETGLVGALPFFLFVGAWFTALARRYIRTGSPESLAAGAVSAGYWLAGLFNFSFWETWWQLSHVLLVAVLLAARAPAPRHADLPVGGAVHTFRGIAG